MPSAELASAAVRTALERGSSDDEVRSRLIRLRREISRRPLDGLTRTIYASLLQGLSRSVEDTRAAAFHAGLAAELSPVTVPILRVASLVLARSGETEQALRLVRGMFEFDAPAAAALLERLEPFVYTDQLERGLADSPGAWIAWARLLHRTGRSPEADALMDRGHGRWPEDLSILLQLSARAVGKQDWNGLSDLLPEDLEIPDGPAAAQLLTYRARARAIEGAAEAARSDVRRALRLGGTELGVRTLAGDALQAVGDLAEARRLWNGLLFELGERSPETRKGILLRLARLEDADGPPATALRLWRSLLEIDPDHLEAQRRVDALAGVRR